MTITAEDLRKIEARRAALINERSSFLSQWQDLARYINPASARFIPTDRNKGDKKNTYIINDTATNASRTLQSGMVGGLSSPARPWILLRTSNPALNEIRAVKVWLEDVRNLILDTFLRSNLYQVLPVAYEDIGTFATMAFVVMEDEDTDIRCYSAPVGSYVIGASSRGSINTFGREYQQTPSQLIEKFGEKAVSPETLDAFKNNRKDYWATVIHWVDPNPDYKPGSPFTKHKRFREVYYEQAHKEKALQESGYDEFPVMVARWSLTGEDIYGTKCPGMQALGDVKQLQKGEARSWEAIEKMIRPPMTAPTSLKGGVTNQLPAGVTFVDTSQGQQGFRPAYEVDPRIEALDAKLARIERRIERAYFADLFLMIADLDRSGITATEINERREEKMLMLGPVLERLNDELFDPLVQRTFNILERRGKLPPPPPELQGAKLTIEYVSILAQAQKMVGVTALEKLTAFIGNLITVFPEAGDKYDYDDAIDQYASMVGAGPRTIRDAKQAEQIRQARAQQQQAQQSMAAAQQGAQTAQTLGQTPITDDTALGAMLGRLGGGAA